MNLFESGEMTTILFVCRANLARSPMAAALFNKVMEEMGLSDQCQAQSAGSWGEDGLPVAVAGVRVMQERGIDISTHRSRIVNEKIVNTADLILTMEKGQKEALRAEFAQISDKIFLLTEMDGLGYDIPDPIGMNRQEFEKTAADLENLITKGKREILRHACPEF